MNRVFLSGNVATNIDFKQTTGGTPVAKFNLAVNRIKEGTDFVPIVAWNQVAENVNQYCTKGSKIIVEGRIQISDYEKEGQKKYSTEVVADRVEFNKNVYKDLKAKTDFDLGQPIKDDDLPWN